jgi:hypothetical protein
MRSENNVSFIKCKLNGSEPYDFVFDTGASFVSISQEVANTLHNNQLLDSNDYIGYTNVLDAVGGISKLKLLKIKKIELEDIIIENVISVVVPNLNAPLLFGKSAMEKMGQFQIDINSNQLIISKSFSNVTTKSSDKQDQLFILNKYKQLIDTIVKYDDKAILEVETIRNELIEVSEEEKLRKANKDIYIRNFYDAKKRYMDSALLIYKSYSFVQKYDSLNLEFLMSFQRFYGEIKDYTSNNLIGIVYDDDLLKKVMQSALFHDKKYKYYNEIHSRFLYI